MIENQSCECPLGDKILHLEDAFYQGNVHNEGVPLLTSKVKRLEEYINVLSGRILKLEIEDRKARSYVFYALLTLVVTLIGNLFYKNFNFDYIKTMLGL